jgi:hypothetical protein
MTDSMTADGRRTRQRTHPCSQGNEPLKLVKPVAHDLKKRRCLVVARAVERAWLRARALFENAGLAVPNNSAFSRRSLCIPAAKRIRGILCVIL